MADHYVCKGEDCSTVSNRPSVCLEPGCMNRYKLLEACSCPHRRRHSGEAAQSGRGGSLDPVNFGVAVGATAALYFLILGAGAWAFGIGSELVALWGQWYIGYDATLLGMFSGALWALVDGFVFGAVLAWLYNLLQKKR